jgi:nucleoside-diphosphate-sugar epimerase
MPKEPTVGPCLFTVLGAGGTIGQALTEHLRVRQHTVQAVGRSDLSAFLASGRPAGHVIDCIGLTGDFRSRPFDTTEAHVGVTARCLGGLTYDSFLFLSSTRVYANGVSTHEDAALSCRPGDPSDLYNLSKLTGEALCLIDPRPTTRVVRLSSVFAAIPGPDTFLGQVLAEGRATGRVLLRQGAGSEKDYVSLDDVVGLLSAIAQHGRHRLYNLASGTNITHGQIADALTARFGWDVVFAPDAPDVRFPRMEITRLNAEFPPPLTNLLEHLATLPLGQEAPCSRSTRQAVASFCNEPTARARNTHSIRRMHSKPSQQPGCDAAGT